MGSGSDERGAHRKRKADARPASRPHKRPAPSAATAEAAPRKEASRAAIKRLVSSFDVLTSHGGDASAAADAAYQHTLAAAAGARVPLRRLRRLRCD